MMKRLLTLLLVLCLAAPGALAAPRLPQLRGTVTDDADVLSTTLASQITDYAEDVADEADIHLYVVVVHFLDGLDAQSYADALFAKAELGEDDLLLLGAAGEDSFATALGADVQKSIGKTNADNLMFTSSAFGTLFQTQQYDAAFAAYFTAFNTLLEKQMNVHIRLNGRFGHTETVSSAPASFGSQLWSDVMDAISDTSQDYHVRHGQMEREESGLTAGGWIVLIVLVLIMMRRNDAEKRRRKQRKRPGCLGWLLGLWGVSALLEWLNDKRH